MNLCLWRKSFHFANLNYINRDMNKLYTVLVLFFLTITLQAQTLVSHTRLSTLPAAGINFLISGLNATYDVELYKVTYNTPDVEGNMHVASGLVCIPINGSSTVFPIAAYQHGTVAGRDDVPSNEAGGHLLAVGFASRGYVVTAADFIGLGDSPGIHPYVHAETEASAAYDLMFAAQELQEELGSFTLNDQVFVSGYSQGGHAAMALHRELEQNTSLGFNVTAAAPMSGPYSISDKMVEFTLSDEEYGTVAYIAWLTLGYKAAYPALLADYPLENVFKPEYLEDIGLFAAEDIDLWELNDRMTETLLSTVGTVTPKNTILPEIEEALKNDPTHPFSMALADNDVFDWAPVAPTQLIYCVGDDQVTFENAIEAEAVMTSNGSTVVEAVRMDIDALLLDHGGCVFPASFHVLDWFDTFRNPNSADQVSWSEGIDISQRGYMARVNVETTELEQAAAWVLDMNGRVISKQTLVIGENWIDLTQLTAGMYVVNVIDNNRPLATKKIIAP